MSTAKRRWDGGSSLLETPPGAYYDRLLRDYDLLHHCGFALPSIGDREAYLSGHWGVLTYLHPALGPTGQLLSQKLCGGALEYGSDLELEIAELYLRNLQLQGSLAITAHSPVGVTDAEGKLRYGEEVGRCILCDVVVRNSGIDRAASCEPWCKKFIRREALIIDIEGDGEFIAEGVCFEGAHHFVVPDGRCLRVRQRSDGSLELQSKDKNKPSWYWHYRREGGALVLNRVVV